MDVTELQRLLEGVRDKNIVIEEALEKLRRLPFEDIGFANIDHHRHLRKGFPEVIYCQGKTSEQISEIVKRLITAKNNILLTKANIEVFEEVKKVAGKAEYNQMAKTIIVKNKRGKPTKGIVLVITAGTSDIPVAEEAKVTAQIMGSRVESLYDVGVAGVHRLFSKKEKLFQARVIVVVAGMDGALPSLVGGLVNKPVIAVPTSIGYGASFGGLAALLSMLNSCASGVATVNIDNGFGAGYLAHVINELGER